MKLQIIADSAGNIVGTARIAGGGQGAPTQSALVPGPDQHVHEIDVADNIAQLDAAELHARYKLELQPRDARLVEVGKPSRP